VPLVEEGWLDHPVTRLTAQEYIKPVLAEHVDTLVLGCTHYPLIKALLQEMVGNDVSLVDSPRPCELRRKLLVEKNSIIRRNSRRNIGSYVSDVPYRFQTSRTFFRPDPSRTSVSETINNMMDCNKSSAA